LGFNTLALPLILPRLCWKLFSTAGFILVALLEGIVVLLFTTEDCVGYVVYVEAAAI